MKKTIGVLVAAGLVIMMSAQGCGPKAGPGESPEQVFNEANAAMAAGDSAAAISLFYRLIEKYPGFKKYRCDILFRLGRLLYVTERYEESEKMLQALLKECRKYGGIKHAYEMLLRIYLLELKDSAKAAAIRAMYAKDFGVEAVKDIDRTIELLENMGVRGAEILSLPAKDIVIEKTLKSTLVDNEFFPVRHYIRRSVKSTDNRFEVSREKTKNGNFLFIRDTATGKKKKVPGSLGGYAPQWSWDSRYVVFTSLYGSGNRRRIKIYDTSDGSVNTLFKGKGIEPILCFSPDSSKIAFAYSGRLWVVNRTGGVVSLLNKNVRVRDVRVLAWSREGDRLLFRHKRKGDEKYWYVNFLGRRVLTILQ